LIEHSHIVSYFIFAGFAIPDHVRARFLGPLHGEEPLASHSLIEREEGLRDQALLDGCDGPAGLVPFFQAPAVGATGLIRRR
jgi:hypothetical protein